MPVVNMPDGTPVGFPDDMPPEQIRRLIENKFPQETAAVAPLNAAASMPQFLDAPQHGNLNVGWQGAGKGLAELAFGIPDLVNTATNIGLAGVDKASQALGGPEVSYRFPMASQESAKLATKAGEKVGITTTDPADMNFKESGLYNVNRFGAQVAGAIPALARVGATRAAAIAAGDALPKFYDSLVKPYAGETAGRTIAGDAAGAAGAGLGETIAQQFVPEDSPYRPLAESGGAIGGGIGGVTALSGIETLGRMLAMLGRRMFGGNVARDIPLDPETGASTSKKAATEAARIMQNEAVDPAAAPIRINENRAALEGQVGVLPSPAALAEDPGLAALERTIRRSNPGEAIARDQKFQTAVRDTVDKVAPQGATTEPLIARAQGEIDRRTADAQRGVDRIEQRAGKVASIRGEHGREVSDFAGQKPDASKALDTEIIDKSLNPLDQQRRALYDAAPDASLPGQPIYEAAQGVRGNVAHLPPNARSETLPSARVKDFEKLGEPILDEQGNVTGYKDVSAKALNDLRPLISKDKANARIENAPPGKIDNLRALQDTITKQTEALPEFAQANKFYNEKYAPVFGREAGEAYSFRQDVNKDRLSRTASPPSETASRFIVAGSPEKTQALQRIIGTMEDPSQAQAAARQYLMADLAEKNVIDGKTGFLRPNALRKWAIANKNTLDVVPGLQKDMTDLIARADKGERIGGKLADELRSARQNQKITEAQVNRSALADVVGSDPDKTVAAIMSNPNSSGQRLKELIDLTAGDEASRNGLKAAVRDYIIDKTTNTASEKLVPGDSRGPVSFAKLTKVFNEHEKELAQVFSPEEMNTLRAGHRALELANVDRLRTTSGSDTIEKGMPNIVDALASTPLGKGVEAFARLKFGLLKAGGMKATARRLSEGIGAPEQDEILRLIKRAVGDPDLMGLLLGRKVPVNSPRWNGKLNRLLGGAEFGRQEYGDEGDQ